MNYEEKLTEAMNMLAKNKRTIFIGQSTVYPGHCLYATIKQIPVERRIELPVVEEMQMGMSIGLALEGYIPISIYPRWDFLILATNQIINHLDKMEQMSDGQFKPKVIIRTCVGSVKPLMPGVQHNNDYTEVFKKLVTNIDIIKLDKVEDIIPAYKKALESDKSSIIVEVADLYHAKSR